MKTMPKLWIGIVILMLLSPLGLLLPEYFKAGEAWGEWKLSSLWRPPLPDYSTSATQEKGLFAASLGYIISAIVGIAVVVLLTILLAKLIVKDSRKRTN